MFESTLYSCLMCPLSCINPRPSTRDSDVVLPEEDRVREPVFLNVYDMYDLNGYIGNLGLGVFHSGVEVFGMEYGYAGHQEPHTGIFDVEPRNERALGEYFNLRGQLRYKQTVQIGYTEYNQEEIEMIRNQLGRKFRGDRYHLINNNCNHFSRAFTKILCQKDIPAWVNRLAYFTSFVPFIQRLLPKDYLTPVPKN